MPGLISLVLMRYLFAKVAQTLLQHISSTHCNFKSVLAIGPSILLLCVRLADVQMNGFITPIPLYHTRSSCVIRGRKWLCHTVYDKTKVFFGASYPVTSTAKPCICIRNQKTAPNNLVGRCRHNHTTIMLVHAHQKYLYFIIKRMIQQFIFPERKQNVFPYWNSEYHTLYHTPN